MAWGGRHSDLHREAQKAQPVGVGNGTETYEGSASTHQMVKVQIN